MAKTNERNVVSFFSSAKLMDIKKEIEQIYPEIVKIRRHLHENPELSEHEEKTAAYVCDILDKHNIKYQSGIAGFGIVAQIGGGSKAVGIRADMDALPVLEATDLDFASKTDGVMHACGHDIHTAILLGSAMLLKKMENKINRVDGAVKLFFQPAEETVGGAEKMIAAGCLENPKVDRVISLHIDPVYPSGSVIFKYGAMNAATQGFNIIVNGKSCHGAHPEGGIDAIVVASEIVTSLQTISSRFNAPTTPVIVTVGAFHAGDAGNVIAGTAKLTGTVRALAPDVMDASKEQLERIARGIASAYGGTAEVIWHNDGYPALINDDETTALVESCAKELYGDENIIIMPEPSLGADDFAYFTEAAKGCYFNIGVTKQGETIHPLHNEHLSPDEESMKTGIAVEIASVIKMLFT
ncbi:MAG: M20 family metallopeptidase [Eubacterium sp.]|nr:M20 family metallopeptidase [Eubacterium sp.]